MLDADSQQDYEALRQRVGFARCDAHTRIELSGDDRARFLHKYCTNDIERLQPGEGCEAFVPNGSGKILGFVVVFCESDRLILETTAGQGAVLLAHFDRFILRAKVTCRETTEDQRLLFLAGPQAEPLLAQGTTNPLPVNTPSCRWIDWNGLHLWVAKVRYVAPWTYLIAIDRSSALDLEQALTSRGVRRCGASALESLRVEASTALFGIDITTDNLPQELGIDARAISFNKGCYLGQETIARIDALGHVNRYLSAVRFESSSIPTSGLELRSNDKPVGSVTSAAWSPRLDAPLALAYVRRGQHQPGSKFQTLIGQAEIVALPIGES